MEAPKGRYYYGQPFEKRVFFGYRLFFPQYSNWETYMGPESQFCLGETRIRSEAGYWTTHRRLSVAIASEARLNDPIPQGAVRVLKLWLLCIQTAGWRWPLDGEPVPLEHALLQLHNHFLSRSPLCGKLHCWSSSRAFIDSSTKLCKERSVPGFALSLLVEAFCQESYFPSIADLVLHVWKFLAEISPTDRCVVKVRAGSPHVEMVHNHRRPGLYIMDPEKNRNVLLDFECLPDLVECARRNLLLIETGDEPLKKLFLQCRLNPMWAERLGFGPMRWSLAHSVLHDASRGDMLSWICVAGREPPDSNDDNAWRHFLRWCRARKTLSTAIAKRRESNSRQHAADQMARKWLEQWLNCTSNLGPWPKVLQECTAAGFSDKETQENTRQEWPIAFVCAATNLVPSWKLWWLFNENTFQSRCNDPNFARVGLNLFPLLMSGFIAVPMCGRCF